MSVGLLPAKQVAELLGVHPRAVHRDIREGQLAASKVGNRYRVPSHVVSAFLGDDADASSVEAVTGAALSM